MPRRAVRVWNRSCCLCLQAQGLSDSMIEFIVHVRAKRGVREIERILGEELAVTTFSVWGYNKNRQVRGDSFCAHSLHVLYCAAPRHAHTPADAPETYPVGDSSCASSRAASCAT